MINVNDLPTPKEFNIWCALNSMPFRMVQHTWPDGSLEWDVEVFPGLPEAAVAYGTGQGDDAVAALLAYAFVAGVEWGEVFAGKRIGETDGTAGEESSDAGEGAADEGESQEVAPPTQEIASALREIAPTFEEIAPPSQDIVEGDAYLLPPLTLMQPAPPRGERMEDEDCLAENTRSLETVLRNFKVRGEVMEVHSGPVVTLYEFEPLPGTKSSTVINLADDIARSMRVVTTRIAVVPGRSAIGIELPNAVRETVYLREILESPAFTQSSAQLPLTLGKNISGDPVVSDLARMPHLLIAGTTGSGKSVGINAMILSLLYRLPPEKCRVIMIDPKMLELSVYDGIPHLLCPVVTDPGKAVRALKWAVREMEDRYRSMSLLGVRNIEGYNVRVAELQASGQKVMQRVQVGFDKSTREPVYEEQTVDLRLLPYIVVVVDEMADLMLVAGRDIEAAIQRLAQMARAAGIHLIMATQRPSVDVITGTIKANFPTRISFQVTSKIDSRTILGESGAEQLVGQGDMLYMAGGGRITRVHGPFVSDAEVQQVVTFLKSQGEPEYQSSITEDEQEEFALSATAEETAGGADDLYDQAVALVLRERKASISFIQRQLQVGYNRSARMVERMEAEGIVSPANHTGKREVLGRGAASGAWED